MHKKTLLGIFSGLAGLLLWVNLSHAGGTTAATPPPPAANALDIGIDGLQPPPPPKKKPELPKKTEYDKLPYAEVLDKANNNDLLAQFELGTRYNYGRSMPRDTNKALQWLRKAAKGDQKDALRLLAVKFYDGYDVVPNYAEAMKWAEKLAELHDVAAQVMMGNMYANGDTRNGKRNLPRAYAWYSIAAVNNSQDENANEDQLGNDELIQTAMDERDKIAGLISAKEEADAQRFASNWWSKHPPPVKPRKMDAGKEAVKPAAPAAQQ